MKPKLLDLFCKAGGCSAGYAKAGFQVTGVDINPQPNYPYEFIHADALEILKDVEFLKQFDVIAASPPCQAHSKARSLSVARNGGQYGEHLDLIPQTRALLIASGKPYVIENVGGSPLLNPIKLYGSQFKNIYTQRERLFESNVFLSEPQEPRKKMKTPAAGNGIGEDGSISICGSGGVRGLNAKQIVQYWGFAMGGIDWMTRAELAEAIPPVYTEFIGKQLQDHLIITNSYKKNAHRLACITSV
jgi:DNA (cytosine-5)-methyltransferase 1